MLYLHKGFLEHGTAADWIAQAHTHTRTPMHAPAHHSHTPLLGHLVKLDRSTQAGPALADPLPLLAMPSLAQTVNVRQCQVWNTSAQKLSLPLSSEDLFLDCLLLFDGLPAVFLLVLVAVLL